MSHDHIQQSNKTAKRRPGRPKQESSSTKLDILRMGSFMFMEQGYEKVSLEAVAKACHITKASVYYYFTNKSTLFTSCLTYVLNIAYQATANILATEQPLKNKMIQITTKQLSNAHIDFESMMRDASNDLSEEQINEIRQAEHQLHNLLRDTFQEAMLRGEINSKHDPLIISHALTALLTIKNHQHLLSHTTSVEQFATSIIELIWDGLKL